MASATILNFHKNHISGLSYDTKSKFRKQNQYNSHTKRFQNIRVCHFWKSKMAAVSLGCDYYVKKSKIQMSAAARDISTKFGMHVNNAVPGHA